MAQLPNQALPAGTRLGVYEIKGVLNVGAFETTYSAWNHHLKERVDVREYFPSGFSMRTQDGIEVEPKQPADKAKFDIGLKQFLEQAESLVQINHPNIVNAENVLSLNGTAYLVLAHQEGAALSKLVQAPGALADAELKFILISLLKALQTAHEAKLIHGGIEPAAILLANNGEPFLTDFTGLRLSLAAQTNQLGDHLVPGYAPPELYEPAKTPLPESDFYALGAAMYYCITGQPPADAQSRRLALSKSEPDPVASLAGAYNSSYSEELLQVIEWMLNLEETDRPHSAAELLSRLVSAPAHSQGEQIVLTDNVDARSSNGLKAKSLAGLWAAAGLIGLAGIIFWLQQKPADKVNLPSEKVIPSQAGIGQSSGSQPVKVEQAAAPSGDQANRQTNPTQSVTPDETATAKPDNPLTRPAAEKTLNAAADASQPLKIAEAENAAIPLFKPTAKPALKDRLRHSQKIAANPKQAALESPAHLPKQQIAASTSTSGHSIHGNLAAAQRAMQQRRLTSPPENNAYHYYQLVLSRDPDNKAAQAGLQKIVNKYLWVIRDVRASGDLAKARRVLQKAESVSPNHSKLQRLRAELAADKE